MSDDLKKYIIENGYHIYKFIRVVDTFKQLCLYYSTTEIIYTNIYYSENPDDKKWYLHVDYIENGLNKVFKFDLAFFRSQKIDELIRDKK
jgi:hypothetical protein